MRRQTAERIDDGIMLAAKMGCGIWIVVGVLLLVGCVHFIAKYW